jgi:hypothetical protein
MLLKKDSMALQGVYTLPHGTADEWNVTTKPPPKGMLAWETDTDKFKVGDGVNPYSNLPYTNIILYNESTHVFTDIENQENMTFNEALAKAELGDRVRRMGWENPHAYLTKANAQVVGAGYQLMLVDFSDRSVTPIMGFELDDIKGTDWIGFVSPHMKNKNDIAWAMEQLKEGKCITNPSWLKDYMCLLFSEADYTAMAHKDMKPLNTNATHYIDNEEREYPCLVYVAMHYKQFKRTLSVTDLLATDYKIYESRENENG